MSNKAIDPQLWRKAVTLATQKHNGQWRKDQKTPYVAHCFRVAMIVRHLFNVDDEVAWATALLHDTIEDTATDYDDVLAACGREVADAVAAMTKDMRLVEDDREIAYDRQLAEASWQARLVKLADVYDNVSDAMDEQMRRKALTKAPRAIKAAGDDRRLQDAIEQLKALASRFGEHV